MKLKTWKVFFYTRVNNAIGSYHKDCKIIESDSMNGAKEILFRLAEKGEGFEVMPPIVPILDVSDETPEQWARRVLAGG